MGHLAGWLVRGKGPELRSTQVSHKADVCQVSNYKIVFAVLKDVPKCSVGPTSGHSLETAVLSPWRLRGLESPSQTGLGFPWEVFIWAAVQGVLLELGPCHPTLPERRLQPPRCQRGSLR